MPQLKQIFIRLTRREASQQRPVNTDLEELPLVEVPETATGRQTLAVLITGDGGWAGIDQQIALGLADRGIGVVGLNSLKYFWTTRSPEGMAADLGSVLEYYLGHWHKQNAVLIGYSMGAETLPFAVNRLPPALRDRTALVVLLAPGKSAEFEFHLSNWIRGASGAQAPPVLPEVQKIGGLKVLCFYGDQERESACPDLDPDRVTLIRMKGTHHLGGDYGFIVRTILSAIK